MAITAYAVVLIIAYAIYDILVLCAILGGLALVSYALAIVVALYRRRVARAETLPKKARVSASVAADVIT